MAEPASSFAAPPTPLSAQLLQLWAERNLPVLYWAAQQALRLHEDTETVNEAALLDRFEFKEALPATEEHIQSLSKGSGHLLTAAPPHTVRIVIVSDAGQCVSLGKPISDDIEQDVFVPSWKTILKDRLARGMGNRRCEEGIGQATSLAEVEGTL